ncbi:MAG: pilus assembly protein PilX [Burkholderiaceae bacterium]|nr:pilus assembly protein PilX [Burkholderiaceae bacterium]
MPRARRRQHGISLTTTIVLVLMSTLLALWSARTALLHERVVGHAADHQRAQEAAEAMLQDAQQDLAQHHQTPIQPLRDRLGATRFPADNEAAFDAFMEHTLIPQAPTYCLHAICAPRTGAQDFWQNAALLAQMTAEGIGARHGQYTQAAPAANPNPLLSERTPGRGAWYWIEVMRHRPAEASGSAAPLTHPVHAPFVYRITALAQGLKTGSQVVLQSVVAFPSITGE